MKGYLRNGLALAAGIILGSVVNMGFVMLGGLVIPPPEGVDPSSMESLKASMHLFEPRHFVFPFVAHALGTLAGALLAARFSASRPLVWALIVASFFLLGGVANAFLLPAPAWFIALDLLVAYLPMGWLGWRLSPRRV